jgi:hypothetical protein
MMLIPMQPGGEKAERINLLLELTKLGPETQRMLLAHFVQGASIEHCAVLFDIAQPNVSRSIKVMNDVNHIVEQIKHIDSYHLTDMKKAIILAEWKI